ncbi:MAG: hypothetical protein JXQ65_05885 [Candidatus Marinimicrobia bacterium]|nr:hypothetical protein [Candidatus Neomarinimicrobiota bacterium]
MVSDIKDLFDFTFSNSKTKILAESENGISVELVEFLGESEYQNIINISDVLVETYGKQAKFSRITVKKYFNYPKTLPFIIRFKGIPQGFVIGVPLENFEKEHWVACDEYFGFYNTIYTYAFIIREEYRNFGLSKILKRIYHSTLKRRGYKFVTGHVREGVSKTFLKPPKVIAKFENWNNTGYTFEYYRTEL